MTFRQVMMSSVQAPSAAHLEDDSAFDDYVFHWQEHRCLLFNHLYPDIGSLLEEEFRSVFSLSHVADDPSELVSDHQLHDFAVTE